MCNIRCGHISDRRLCELLAFAVALCVVFFVVSKLIFMQAPNRECTEDAQCVGEESLCLDGACDCVPAYFHTSYRCDIHHVSVWHIFTILYQVCAGCALFVLCTIGRREYHSTMQQL